MLTARMVYKVEKTPADLLVEVWKYKPSISTPRVDPMCSGQGMGSLGHKQRRMSRVLVRVKTRVRYLICCGPCCLAASNVALGMLQLINHPWTGMNLCGAGKEKLTRQRRKEKAEKSFLATSATKGSGIFRMVYWPLASGAERDPRPRVTDVHTSVAMQPVLAVTSYQLSTRRRG